MAHEISLAEAAAMTARYREGKSGILNTGLEEDILPNSETFDKSEIQRLLDQDGCKSLRIYYGMDADLKIHAILVGVNAQDEDMIEGSSTPGEVLEMAQRCPEVCPPGSVLNS
jgi:hypothetical protein